MEVVKYAPRHKEKWNAFVNSAKNSSFLLSREYLEYHADRFEDASIIVYEGQEIVLVFPANKRSQSVIASHDGLTYGGFILGRSIKLPVALQAMRSVIEYYNTIGFSTIELKVIPKFYETMPSDEVNYAMFLCGAELYRMDTALVVDQSNRIKYSNNYRREAKRARIKKFTVSEEADFGPFWEEVLEPNLYKRFGIKPVHSLGEIEYLKLNFPESIKCYTVRDHNGVIQCGTVFYVYGHVAHAQYIASTDAGRTSGSLNLLFIQLLDDCLSCYRYFDFGIANEKQGRELNLGLLAWKERMGGRAMVHNFYRIDTSKAHHIGSAENVSGV